MGGDTETLLHVHHSPALDQTQHPQESLRTHNPYGIVFHQTQDETHTQGGTQSQPVYSIIGSSSLGGVDEMLQGGFQITG